MFSIQKKLNIPINLQCLYLSHINFNCNKDGIRLDIKKDRKLSSISNLRGEIVILKKMTYIKNIKNSM
jgi:hypothetical protein